MQYDGAWVFSEGLAGVKMNGKRGFIDKNGKEVIPCKYFIPCNFSKGLVLVQMNGKWFYIDKNGKEYIKE